MWIVNILWELDLAHIAKRIKQTLKNLLYNIAVYYENISVEANMVATIRKQYNQIDSSAKLRVRKHNSGRSVRNNAI